MNSNLYILIGGLIVIAILVFVCMKNKGVKEGYTSNSADNVGALVDYQKVEDPVDSIPGEHFADMVGGVQTKFYDFQPEESKKIRPMERLSRVQGSQAMPRTSKNVTAYNVDVADPSAYMYQVQTPRVLKLDPLAAKADPYRGDIPITIYADVPVVGRSKYGRDSLRLDGYFSESLNRLFDKYTGKAFTNKPMAVVNQGLIMDN